MKLNWLIGAALATAIVVPASAQISIHLRTGPPAPRYERRGVAPGSGYVWVDGYWGQSRGHYQWVEGRWQQPPYEGAYWSHPHYDHERRGWRMHEGHWDHEDHGYHDDHDRRDHDHNRR